MGSACCSHDDANSSQIDSEAIKQLEVSDEAAPADPIEPEAAKPMMTITIIGARGIRNSDWLPGSGKPDCYCVAKKAGKILHKTETITDSLAPQWSEEFDVFDYNGEEFEFNVWDSDVIGEEFLGKVVLKPEQFMENGLNGDYEMEEAGTNIRAYLGLKIKLPSKLYPSRQGGELEVTIEKGETNAYGIELDDQDKVNLYVCKVNEGAIQKHNDSVKATMKVMQSDFITSVNGVKGDAEEMLKQFKEAKVTIKLRRAVDLVAILEKEHATSKLGVIVPKPCRVDALVILNIEDGILKAYNDKCTKESDKIIPRDRIVSVKGEVGLADQLKSKLMGMTGKFQVGIQRPC